MNYLSLDFVGFVALAFLLYYIMPKKARWGVLLLASVTFYALFDCKYVAFLLFAALSTYLTALAVEKGKLKGLLISLCILLNAGVWFYIKELSWALTTAGRVLGKLGVAIRSGSHCAIPLHASLGLIGTGRISVALHTTRADLDAALLAIEMCRRLYEDE